MAKSKSSEKDPLEAASEAPKASETKASETEVFKDTITIKHPDELIPLQDKGKLAGFSGWFFDGGLDKDGIEVRLPSIDKKGDYVFVKGAKAICKIIPALFLACLMCFGTASADIASTDIVVHTTFTQDAGWKIDSGGDLVPISDSDMDIGETGFEVQAVYTDALVLNGVTITSAGQLAGAWTDTGLTTTMNAAPAKFIGTHSTGNFAATGFTAGTGDIALENGQTIDGGTDTEIILGDNSDTLAIDFTGNDVSLTASDGGIIFNTDASDSTGTFDFCARGDTDDCLVLDTVSDVPTITTDGGSNLAITSASGTVAVTGILTVSGATTVTGILTASTTITLQNSETIVNSTNQIVTVSSNAASPILQVLDPGTNDTDAVLRLSADAAADNGDTWDIVSDGATNALQFQNDTTGSMVTKFQITKTGAFTFQDDVTLENGEIIENGTDDTIGLQSNDASLIIRAYSPNATNGTVALQLVGDAADDATDAWQIINNADGTLTIGNDSTASEAYITKLSLDSTGAAIIEGSEGTAGSLAIWADNGDDAIDKFTFSMSAADVLTMVTGSTTAQTIDTAGLTTFAAATVTGATLTNGAVTLGNAITDVVTVTGKIAGATPLSFDGSTADTVYTILAITDPQSSSKTVTLPSITSSISLETATTTVITADTTATITIIAGVDAFYTYTIDTDNEDCTLTFSAGGTVGDRLTIMFITDASTGADEVMTFHATLSNTEGTLTLAAVSQDRYVITFISDGSVWNEVSRTAVLTT